MSGGATAPAGIAVDVIAVFGPTGSGKTAVAEALADALGTEVISADAMQVYRGLPILTNQPERPTHLVAFRGLAEEMSVGAYAALAHAEIDELVGRRGSAVVAGGTGLYLRAALTDLRIPVRGVPRVRDRLEREYGAAPAVAHARLAALDPRAAALVHPNDRRRVVRALELAEAGASLVPDDDRLWAAQTRRPSVVVGLHLPPEELERRIRARTAAMFERGVVEEVRGALCGELSRTAEKILGLGEIAALDADAARERIVLRTRRYAAYQRRWMRRIPGIVMIDGSATAMEVADAVLEVARAR